MGITVKAHVLSNPRRMTAKLAEVLHNEVAPVVGLFLVRQVEHTHDVQGRTEDDSEGVWPPRKPPSSGLIVFGQRKEVLAAIKQLIKDKDQQVFTIKRAEKSLGAERDVVFTRKQVQGAKLAIEAEQRRKRFQKKAKGFAGISTAKEKAAARQELKQKKALALIEGRLVEAARKDRQLQLLAAAISKGTSYRNSATYLPRPVLLRTGALKSSWTYRVLRQNDLVVVFIGTTIHYARYHELGLGVPQRKQVVISNNDRKRIAELTNSILGRKLLE